MTEEGSFPHDDPQKRGSLNYIFIIMITVKIFVRRNVIQSLTDNNTRER